MAIGRPGFVEIGVSFPKLKGFDESGLLKLAHRMIATWMDEAVEEIKNRWYEFVTYRTGRSGKSWNVVEDGMFNFLFTNSAAYRGREYAEYVHPAGSKTPLVKTLVRRILAKYRKIVTQKLLSSRAAGGGAAPTSITFKQAVKDALLSEMAASLF